MGTGARFGGASSPPFSAAELSGWSQLFKSLYYLCGRAPMERPSKLLLLIEIVFLNRFSCSTGAFFRPIHLRPLSTRRHPLEARAG
ncbi:protein of unknown function (plasmid) [Azospirillum lipoferum 4B]|uniref:Uncharacterized protein n=1 Tax=Azospirillum lipoferum (strain 4B) TaxID=862719 RepID=G7ZFK6_AZOL4|nr:protein of unknown function [Azospirillum lipoferum 4B]